MATRMQQRRGTAQQWTDANPVLAAGEIGFETDTNEFRIGDGVNTWSSLSPFKNLEDLGGSLDDYINVSQKGADGGVASLDQNGNVPISQLGSLITDAPGVLDTLGELADFVIATDTAVTTHNNQTVNVHGIADTSMLATMAYVDIARTGAYDDAVAEATLQSGNALDSHSGDTTNVHGILNTADLALISYVDDEVSQGLADHNLATENVHGIADTSALETTSGAQSKVNTAVSDHNADTTNVHGISDTAALATKTYADGAVSTAVAALTKSSVGLGNVDNTADADKPVSTATQTALDLKAPKADPTFTGTVSGVTKSMVGLGNVDNTADSAKPVSTATQTALDAKASLAGATFTGDVTVETNFTVDGNLTVSGTTTTVNTTNFTTSDPLIYLGEGNNANLVDVGFVGSYNDGTYAHQGLVKDSSDGKWKLFKGVTDEPTTTVNFAQGSLDALKVGALEATTVTPSSGIVFSDGTQTKEGVVSRTPIVSKTDSYTLSALTERDSLIEISKSTAVTLTIPTNATLALPVGTSIDILQTGAGQVTIAGAAGVTVNATPGLKLRTQWSGATLFKRATDSWVVYGDLSA